MPAARLSNTVSIPEWFDLKIWSDFIGSNIPVFQFLNGSI